MKKLLSGLLVFCLAACSAVPSLTPTTGVTQEQTAPSPTATLAPSSTASPTRTPRPSATQAPTPTLTPTSTPRIDQPLAEKGPYLTYVVKTTDGGRALTILNADASGRAVVPLPKEATLIDLARSVSPDGEWLAFYTGSYGILKNSDFPPEYDMSGTLDFQLNLMHLPDGQIKKAIRLLSPDYPANFDKMAASLFKSDPDYSTMKIETVRANVILNFITGIQSMDWSPNSRYLAFAGEMDGPSSDLYRLEVTRGSILRLTDGPGQMEGTIRWSPDGKWIAHTSTNEPPGVGPKGTVYAVRTDGSEAKSFEKDVVLMGWLSSNTMLLDDFGNGKGSFNLHSVNVEIGKVTVLWQDSYRGYTLLPNDDGYAICGEIVSYTSPEEGLYLVRSNGGRTKVHPSLCAQLAYRGTKTHRFVSADYENGILGFAPDGSMTTISSIFGWIDISTDRKWMLLENSGLAGNFRTIELYDEKDTLVRVLTSDPPDKVFWRPDSQGIYYVVGSDLYYISIPDGKPVLVDEALANNYQEDRGFQWIN